MNQASVFLRQASADDIEALEQLLNRCYRQTEGWTNEANLIGGIRITPNELANTIANPKHYLLCIQRRRQASEMQRKQGSCLVVLRSI